jgi:hypothetical protein
MYENESSGIVEPERNKKVTKEYLEAPREKLVGDHGFMKNDEHNAEIGEHYHGDTFYDHHPPELNDAHDKLLGPHHAMQE